MAVNIRHKEEVHVWEVGPNDTVQQLQVFVQNRWGIEPAQQRVQADGLPISPTLRLGLLGDGIELQVLRATHGGGFEKARKGRKRGGKGSSVQRRYTGGGCGMRR